MRRILALAAMLGALALGVAAPGVVYDWHTTATSSAPSVVYDW